jgi:hypothetical protein
LIGTAVFWDVTPCGSYNNQLFGGTYRSIIRVTRIGVLGTTLAVTSNRSRLRKNTMLLVTANVPSSPILVTLMLKAIHSSETSVLTRATRRNPRRRILYSHRREYIKYFIASIGWAL